MNTHTTLSRIVIACTVIPLLLAGCQPAPAATSQPTTQPTAVVLPTQPPAPTQTQATPLASETEVATATQPSSSAPGELSFDLSGVAQDQTVETVAAQPPDSGGPYWDVAPQYRRVTLQGYPVTNHLMKPQILVYPVADLAGFNEAAGQIAVTLQTLLQNQQIGEFMPFLPLFNAQQVTHAQVQYLEFKNGKGVRFLTQFDQAPLPINNYELIYTFQGLTSDGKYYVAAILPVTHPDLPANGLVSAEQAAEMNDFPAYMAKTTTWLDQQPASSFTPDLAKLDAMMQSIEVK